MSTPLAKGQNGPLSVDDVIVSLDPTAPAYLSALLVTESGKVRSDADFVFFNRPSGPGVQLVPERDAPAPQGLPPGPTAPAEISLTNTRQVSLVKGQ